MKSRERHKKHLLAPQPEFPSKSGLNLRLCHRCLYLNESPEEIKKCGRCESQFLGESMASSPHWEDDEWDEPLSPAEELWQRSEDGGERAESQDSQGSPLPRKRRRLNGLAVRW